MVRHHLDLELVYWGHTSLNRTVTETVTGRVLVVRLRLSDSDSQF